MTRRLDQLYAGAAGRTTLSRAAQAGARFVVVQAKLDGCFVLATTDGKGRIAHLYSRKGLPFSRHLAAEFEGVRWAPDSVVTGEVEYMTEAANRCAAARGHRLIHLFDALRVAGRDVSSLPYAGRRDALLRAESALVNEDLDKPWREDELGLAHDPASGRYVRPVPRSWRRMPVVPQLPAHRAEAAWADWVERGEAGPVEGLVLVALPGRLGARGAKRKIKDTRSIDATVVSVGRHAVGVAWAGYRFTISAFGRAAELQPGQVVEVLHDGWHEAAVQPRCARIGRVRHDLQGATP